MIGLMAHPKNMIALCDRDGGKRFVIHLAMEIGANTTESEVLEYSRSEITPRVFAIPFAWITLPLLSLLPRMTLPRSPNRK